MVKTRSLAVAAVSIAFLAGCGGSSSGAATNFGANLAGGNEVPATTSTATDTAAVTLSATPATYTVTYTGLPGAPTGSHIHVIASNGTGPFVIKFSGLPATAAGTFSGTFTSADVQVVATPAVATFDDVVAQIRAGNTYVNIHTAASPAGEIRGALAAK